MNESINPRITLENDIVSKYNTINDYCNLMHPRLSCVLSSFTTLFYEQAKTYRDDEKFIGIVEDHLDSISSLEIQIGVTYVEMSKHMNDVRQAKSNN